MVFLASRIARAGRNRNRIGYTIPYQITDNGIELTGLLPITWRVVIIATRQIYPATGIWRTIDTRSHSNFLDRSIGLFIAWQTMMSEIKSNAPISENPN